MLHSRLEIVLQTDGPWICLVRAEVILQKAWALMGTLGCLLYDFTVHNVVQDHGLHTSAVKENFDYRL